MRSLAYEGNIFMQTLPVNLATGANDPIARIDVSQYSSVEFCIIHAVGTAAEPIVATVSQHDAVTVGNTKVVPIKKVLKKSHLNIEDATEWVAEPATAINGTTYVYTESVVEKEAILLIPVDVAELDVSGGFKWISIAVADTGNGACIGLVLILCYGPRHTPPADSV